MPRTSPPAAKPRPSIPRLLCILCAILSTLALAGCSTAEKVLIAATTLADAPPAAPAPTIAASASAHQVVVTLADTAPAASIFYTTDGSTPSGASNLYTAPVTLTASATVKAIAIAGGSSSPVVSQAFTLTAQPALPLVTARSAAEFVSSVGINVHFNYYGSIYASDTPLMIQALQALGVTHLRDAMCWQGSTPQNTFYLVHQQLAALGFRTDYVASIAQPMSQVAAYPALVSDMEAVEPANEYDASGDPNWAAVIAAQQAALYATIHPSGAASNVTVLAPSLAQPLNAPQLGDLAAIADAGNLHGYMGGYNPASPVVNPASYLADVQPNTPSQPVWVTETGYFAQPGPIFGMYGVSPAAQAVYAPRLLLEYANAGAARTYLYELADDLEPGENPANYHWGLLNSDGSQKPAFAAVANLLATLSDPASASSDSSTFTPTPLAFALQNAGANLHQALFQKRDGTYFLALWIEAQSYDFLNQVPIAVPTQNVTLQLGGAVVSAQTTQWDDDGNAVSSPLSPGQTIPLTVSDKLQIVKLVLQ